MRSSCKEATGAHADEGRILGCRGVARALRGERTSITVRDPPVLLGSLETAVEGVVGMRGWRDVFATVRIAFAVDGRSSFPEHVSVSPVVHRSPAEHKAVVYRRVFDENWPRVRRHLACFLDDADEVDELTAEVFVIAWKKLDPARPMGLTWFLRTAANKVRDANRRARSKDRALDALTRGLQHPSAGVDPLESLALRDALGSLNARERHVVVLTYWDDLTAGEVAEVLRCSQASVWTTLTRARAKLRRHLDATGGES